MSPPAKRPLLEAQRRSKEKIICPRPAALRSPPDTARPRPCAAISDGIPTAAGAPASPPGAAETVTHQRPARAALSPRQIPDSMLALVGRSGNEIVAETYNGLDVLEEVGTAAPDEDLAVSRRLNAQGFEAFFPDPHDNEAGIKQLPALSPVRRLLSLMPILAVILDGNVHAVNPETYVHRPAVGELGPLIARTGSSVAESFSQRFEVAQLYPRLIRVDAFRAFCARDARSDLGTPFVGRVLGTVPQGSKRELGMGPDGPRREGVRAVPLVGNAGVRPCDGTLDLATARADLPISFHTASRRCLPLVSARQATPPHGALARVSRVLRGPFAITLSYPFCGEFRCRVGKIEPRSSCC